MKRLLFTSLLGLAAFSLSPLADARVGVSIGIGIPVVVAPPVVYAPAPMYGPPPVVYGNPYYGGAYYGHPRGWHGDRGRGRGRDDHGGHH